MLRSLAWLGNTPIEHVMSKSEVLHRRWENDLNTLNDAVRFVLKIPGEYVSVFGPRSAKETRLRK